MKVVFCAYDGKDIINGINTWLIRLLPALAKRHIEVSVIFIAWAAERDCTSIKHLREKGIKCTVIPTAHYTQKQVKWMLQYLQTEQADVFVPGNMVPALHAAKWVKEAGIATVAVLHSYDEEYLGIIDQFVTGGGNLTGVVAVSEVLYRIVNERNQNIKLYKIPCGAPVPEQKATLKPGDVFKVIYIGRIVKEQKRIDEITTAFCECAQMLTNAAFYIYGSGPDEAIVFNILSNYNNPKNVFFGGGILPDNVQEVMLTSHVMVLMSAYEGIPVALMEAMACGVVPVSTLVNSGIPELVNDGVTGFLIDDRKGLLPKIQYLKQNIEEWEKLSASCRKLIEEQFSSERNLDAWVDLLNEIVGEQKQTITIPLRINLPPAHPYFIWLDRREPSILVKAYKKLKRILYR